MTNIAELRARKNRMSQKELAEKIGVTQASISLWENNPLSMNAVNIVKVCKFFEVTSDEILGINKDKEVTL
ncbi:helix-turn-helix transcriptional regulator [Vagococcus fluvialis]|uniref:helix-turn-helix transcriptional regulator n=1 Tax=Vagococcus fluvialis TaxID=2738 RepID=UPI0020340734|nr:helix-turn-helix transcriptional regulator [Vagococcus fluvialis]MCM2138862.1 helix-turn-helix transcriptional regulator [Vagococcus fluvialis]